MVILTSGVALAPGVSKYKSTTIAVPAVTAEKLSIMTVVVVVEFNTLHSTTLPKYSVKPVMIQ